MGFVRGRILVPGCFLLLSLTVFTGSADAAANLLSEQMKLLLTNLSKVLATADPQAGIRIATQRDEIPNAMATHSAAIAPTLLHEVEEIQDNINDRLARTGENGIPLWPQNEVLIGMLTPLMETTFDLSYQSKLGSSYSPYLSKLQAILDSITPPASPPEGAPPFVPSLGALQEGAAYFNNESAKIRQGASALKGFRVGGADSAPGLEQSLRSAQGQIGGARGIHPIVDGAVDGLINSLNPLIKVAQQMNARYDYFNQDLVDAIVALANSQLEGNAATKLNAVTDSLANTAKGLTNAIVSIQRSEGGTNTAGATAIVSGLLQSAVSTKAAAEAAVAGLAVRAADLEAQVDQYYINFLRDKHRHCYHEDISAEAIMPLYGMQDQYENLQNPTYVLAELNGAVWATLKDSILPLNTQLSTAVQQKSDSVIQTAASRYGIPYKSGAPIPGVPQFRFSGECGEYIPDPHSSGLVVSAAEVGQGVREIQAATVRLSREVKRRVKATKTVCPVTDLKCIKNMKKKAQIQKRIEKDRKKLTGVARKFSAELPARLNKAYFGVYGKYPAIPFH